MMRKQVLRAATLGCIIVVKTDNNLRTDVCNAAIQRLVDVLADLGTPLKIQVATLLTATRHWLAIRNK